MIEPNFQVKIEKESREFGVFTLEPLQRGYGQTLGNALRRVLLSSLPGAAITKAKISGTKHLFSTLKGLKEDVVEFMLNVKKIRLAYSGDKPVKISLSKTGPGPILAGDFEVPAEVEIINKDLVLGSLSDSSSHFKGDFWVSSGYGYVPFEETPSEEIGIIPLDGVFTPIKRVNYKVSATRVGRVTDFDKLTIEIITDGTIKPKDAFIFAAKKLSTFFTQIYNPKEVPVDEELPPRQTDSQDESLTVEELGLPTRIINALLKVGVKNVADLRQTGFKKLSKIKNLGGKSLKIIETALVEKDIKMEE